MQQRIATRAQKERDESSDLKTPVPDLRSRTMSRRLTLKPVPNPLPLVPPKLVPVPVPVLLMDALWLWSPTEAQSDSLQPASLLATGFPSASPRHPQLRLRSLRSSLHPTPLSAKEHVSGVRGTESCRRGERAFTMSSHAAVQAPGSRNMVTHRLWLLGPSGWEGGRHGGSRGAG